MVTSVDITCRARFHGRGFSLIELVAVMSVAAILAAVAIPAMSSTTSMRRKSAAAQLARDLRLARDLSLTTGRRSWVSFNTGAESYSLLLEPVGNPGRTQSVAWTDPASGRAFQQVFGTSEWAGITIDNLNVDGGGSWIGFDSLGRPVNSNESELNASASITLSGNYVVRVEPGTGHIGVTP
jgi:prepilin-type N-terminal cleavage/methylation domain-containing protein